MTARSVASFPGFVLPKLPNKLIFVGFCVLICIAGPPEAGAPRPERYCRSRDVLSPLGRGSLDAGLAVGPEQVGSGDRGLVAEC